MYNEIKDVWNGPVLKLLCRPGRFFSNLNNLALSFNLPREVRMNAENIILCGLWIGPTKPLMHPLLEPILKTMRELSTVGLSIKVPSGDHATIGLNWYSVYSICRLKHQYYAANSSMENTVVQFVSILAFGSLMVLIFKYQMLLTRSEIMTRLWQMLRRL